MTFTQTIDLVDQHELHTLNVVSSTNLTLARRPRTVGTATIETPTTRLSYGDTPGNDRHLTIEPQTVPLETDGNEVWYTLTGTVVARGHYGGRLGVDEIVTVRRYAYELDPAIRAASDPNAFTHDGVTYRIDRTGRDRAVVHADGRVMAGTLTQSEAEALIAAHSWIDDLRIALACGTP